MKRLLILCTLLIGISALPTSAILDTNQNQLSDLWERAFNGGNLFPPGFDLQADEDGDGWTNAEEEAAGTDPFDPNSPGGLLRPDITHIPESWADLNGDGIEEHTPEAIIISWPTIAGKQYSLLYSPDLADWLPVPGETLVGEGTILDYHITLTGDDRIFWRVAVTDIDSDGDGLTDAEEFVLGTDPASSDSDLDGLSDYAELTSVPPSNPNQNANEIDPDGHMMPASISSDLVAWWDFQTDPAGYNPANYPSRQGLSTSHILALTQGATSTFCFADKGISNSGELPARADLGVLGQYSPLLGANHQSLNFWLQLRADGLAIPQGQNTGPIVTLLSYANSNQANPTLEWRAMRTTSGGTRFTLQYFSGPTAYNIVTPGYWDTTSKTIQCWQKIIPEDQRLIF